MCTHIVYALSFKLNSCDISIFGEDFLIYDLNSLCKIEIYIHTDLMLLMSSMSHYILQIYTLIHHGVYLWTHSIVIAEVEHKEVVIPLHTLASGSYL